jgi:large subunit ribosomal protein L15
MITLSSLRPSSTRTKYKRVGRGNSSGKGTTAGRGTKGQRARTGGRNKLTRRSLKSLILPTPKYRGFTSHKPKLHVVTLAQLQTFFADGAAVTPAELKAKGIIPSVWPGVKVLASGTLSKKLTVRAAKFSAGAAEAITKAGGVATMLVKPSRTLPKKQRPTT